MPSRFLQAISFLLAGMMTFAPAVTSALVVSRPIPEYPPVTIAVLLLISIPFVISSAFVFE